MRKLKSRSVVCSLLLPFLIAALAVTSSAAGAGTVRGRVLDPLGAAVQNARVILLEDETVLRDTHTDREGKFQFSSVNAGRYRVRVEAGGFVTQESLASFLSGGAEAVINIKVALQIGPLRQEIVVSDTGTALPKSEVGASVSVIDGVELRDLHKLDVLDALRLVPGVEVTQTGQRGGTTDVFVRGGEADFNKVLIDGIPANDIGGAFEFGNLSTNGVDQLEVLRGPNSVLYGSDALGSVINVTSRRGSSAIPEFTYSADGGNFHTYRQEVSLGGAFRQFDYFSDLLRFDTQNSLPNSSFHNLTYAGNFGWQPDEKTQIRFTLRHTATGLGDPNALALYGVADDSFQREQESYLGVTVQNQTTRRWHNLLRLTSTELQFHFDNPAPTGTPFDPFGFGPNYLGEPVTLCGANGYCTGGQAILDFGGTYPQPFDSVTRVRSLEAQSEFAIKPNLSTTFGFRYDHEVPPADVQALADHWRVRSVWLDRSHVEVPRCGRALATIIAHAAAAVGR